jgi:hypothetical protein
MAGDMEYRARLPSRVRFGCAVLQNADRLDLIDASFVNSDGGVAIMLLDSPKHPDGSAFVAVRMYRFPRRRVRFESDYDWFCKTKKDRCRLPDRTAVTDESLALVQPPAGWSHDARPQSGRDLYHVYLSPQAAVIFQVGVSRGAGPDHPLVQAVRESLRIDSGQWIATKPGVRGIGVPRLAVVPPRKSRKAPVAKPRGNKRSEPKAVSDVQTPSGRAVKGAIGPEPWRGEWPRNQSIRDWLLALLEVADGVAVDEESSGFAIAAIEKLGRIGDGKAAIPYVDEYLRRIPPSCVSTVLQLATTGADVCLRAGDLVGMERYLAVAIATEPYNTRKVDVGYSLREVLDFRARRGILDPAEAGDEDRRRFAAFKQAARLFRQALEGVNTKNARDSVVTMSLLAKSEREEWLRHDYLREVIAAWADLNDVAEIRRHLKMLDPDERHKTIETSVLVRLGMVAEMLPRVRAVLRKNLDAVTDLTNLNSHHDIDLFVRNLRRLDEMGARDEARRWLRRAVNECGGRNPSEIGAFSSAIPGLLAEAANSLGEMVIARQLLGFAKGEAKQERRNGWRQAAVGRWLVSAANAGMFEAAIDEARRIRPIRKRRQKLAELFALIERWDDLHELLNSIESAEEVAEAVWWLHLELPGAGTV